MSTTTLPVAGSIGVHHRAFWRFAWKEYRMLRGFWLAVAALAVVIQLITLATLPVGPDRAAMLFAIALGATALYAVGAAATLFAVEHEEETYELLMTLPVEWSPVFFAKLFVAVTSSAALLAALVISSLARGGEWNRNVAYLLLPAIAESIAWGIFMSLTIRRPLVAAVATIAVVSVQVNLVMSFMTAHSVAILNSENYPLALSWRLAITAVVLLLDLTLGREWLRVRETQRSGLWKRWSRSNEIPPAVQSVRTGQVSTRRMMLRLLWQTWRESWLAMGLMIVFTMTAGLIGILIASKLILDPLHVEPPAAAFAVTCVLCALYGSQVFSADQRGKKHLFLAEHAARPRLVWLCRHVVWLGGLGALAGLALLLIGPAVLLAYKQGISHLDAALATYQMWWRFPDAAIEYLRDSTMLIDVLFAALFAAITGYAAGQFASLLLRRSITAGFLAMLLAVVLAAWGVVVYLWQLPQIEFLGLLAFSFFLATWLRVPDWLVERNSAWSWSKVSAAVLVPGLIVLVSVPSARLAQVARLPDLIPSITRLDRSPSMENPLPVAAYAKVNQPSARAAGEELVRLAESITMPPKPERLEVDRDIWLDVLTPQWRAAYNRQAVDLNKHLIEWAIELSKQPACEIPIYQSGANTWNRLILLAHLVQGAGDADLRHGRLDAALERYLAALRILGNARRGQRKGLIKSTIDSERTVLGQFVSWASHQDQTSERLLAAIDRLDRVYPTTKQQWLLIEKEDGYLPPLPTEFADHTILSQVIQGDQSPLIVDPNRKPGLSAHVAVLANRLPFERERALRVLTELSFQETQVAARLFTLLVLQQDRVDPLLISFPGLAEQVRNILEESLRQSLIGESILGSQKSPADTSYLLAKEHAARTNLWSYLETLADHYVRQLGVKLQLALIAYELDHGAYPTSLDELVPDYLPSVPVDPYAGWPFQYEPAGLPLELISGHESVPPHGPFFWSVGQRNCQLIPSRQQIPRDSTSEEPEYEKVFGLVAQDTYPWGSDALIFRLPPLDRLDTDTTPTVNGTE